MAHGTGRCEDGHGHENNYITLPFRWLRVHVFQIADTSCCGSKSPNKYALHYLKVLYYRLRATML